MDVRITLLISWSVLLLLFISCETHQSETNLEHQQSSINTDQMAARDTIDGLPVIPAPGAQIDKEKVAAVLEAGGISYSDVLTAQEIEDIERSIGKLNQLLQKERVLDDKELQFMIHTLLGTSYYRLYDRSEQQQYLSQAEEHLNSAILLFENQPEYKTDLAGTYAARLGVYKAREEYDKALSHRKFLIEEFQGIRYGFYENWFASREVEALYNWARKESFESGKNQEIINYLHQLADKYDNEVGVTAQMLLARHYALEDQQERVKKLTESIEQRYSLLDNPAFKEEKWDRYKIQLKSIENRKKHVAGQTEPDTLFYEIQPEMIDRAIVRERERAEPSYYIWVQLKSDYHLEFGELTAENIGNFLAVVHKDEVVSPAYPTIQNGVSGGRFSIGPFDQKEDAQEFHQQILNE